jgi:hypothetical protein
MNTASNARSKRRTFWRADWWAGVLVVLAVLVLPRVADLFGAARHPSARMGHLNLGPITGPTTHVMSAVVPVFEKANVTTVSDAAPAGGHPDADAKL